MNFRLKKDKSLIINPTCRWREEDFGGVINVRRTKNVYVDESGLRFFKSLANKQNFTVNDILSTYSDSKGLRTLFGYLWESEAII
jgi:hypothetical protein